MGAPKEKRHDLDPPQSKRSRDGAPTVLSDLNARIVVASENESHVHEVY